MKIRPILRLAPLFFAVAIIAGCGKGEQAKLATQVVAKVNGDEITVHQVNNFLSRTQNVTPEAEGNSKREILNRLIDQQLAMQHAIDKKLDRSPSVMQAIEAARSEILARAYLEQIAVAEPKLTAEEIKKYYAEHPELFAKRRIFNLEEILVLPKEDIATGLREQTATARSMQDVAAWLKSQNAKFTVNRGERAAEQIPLELLPKLAAMKDGEIGLVEAGGHLEVFQVIATQAAPVDEATAAPHIKQFLFNQRASEAGAREIKRIRENANVVYVGEFAKEATAAETAPATQAESPPAAPPIQKGVRGLQ